jgi:hypothetical protein
MSTAEAIARAYPAAREAYRSYLKATEQEACIGAFQDFIHYVCNAHYSMNSDPLETPEQVAETATYGAHQWVKDIDPA